MSRLEGQKDDIERNHEKAVKLLGGHLQRADAAESYKGKFERVESRYNWLEEQLKAQAEADPNELAEQAMEQIEKLGRKLDRETEKADSQLQGMKEKFEADLGKLFELQGTTEAVKKRLSELDSVKEHYEELSNKLTRVGLEINQKITNPKLDHVYMQIEFINKKIENHMLGQGQTEQDQSFLIKETSALRKDFQGLEQRVLVERYPPLEKGLK